MTSPTRRRMRTLGIGLGCTCLLLAVYAGIRWRQARIHPERSYILETGKMANWKAYGGTWEIADGIVRNNSDERGAKLLAGSTEWSNYTLTADVRFDGERGDVGVIVRSNEEDEGVDAYNGYYVGLRRWDGTVVIGRSNYGWIEARPVPMPGGVHASAWYRLRVTAFGCNIAASSQNLSTLQTAWAAFQEQPCVKSGRVGLRSLDTGGMWRNIVVSPATFNDYQELRRYATLVEHPEFPKREADYNSFFRYLPADNSTSGLSHADVSTVGQITHIGDLQDVPRTEGQLVVVRGVVTLTNPALYIQDSTGGIRVRNGQIPHLNVGDTVEVSGHALPGLYSAVISGGTVRPLWGGPPPPPIAITPSQAASGAYDSRFVEIEGQLTGIEVTPSGDQVLDFTQGGQSFRATYANRPRDVFHQLESNSFLRIRGVCALNRGYTHELTPFVVLLRSIDDVDVLAGPPWWTPWHIGMLFIVAIALALSVQFSYFRIQQWKAHAITQERNRLANVIHDTMAQSFAGIGYQIQGIRTGVLKEEHQDSHRIADQLNVAYQLVRSCHEESSRTISMLGSSAPKIQYNLLETLAETARQIAGDRFRTETELMGTPFPLNLRLAYALLQIGQEAIANAVSHSNLTILKIALSYEADAVDLVVEDNGQGFDYIPDKAGFGILGMQRRARDVECTLQVVSAPRSGTQVHVHGNCRSVSFQNRVFALAKNKIKRLNL